MSEQLIATPGVFGENGNFLLERELGAGGMGGVYMGRDKMLDRPVAVKVMLKEYGADAEFVEKFKKEAQAAAKLIHPNIAQIYSYGICDGMPYIAMELVAGGSLDSLMKHAEGGKTDVPRVMKICQQVAQALQCASDQGYVHGDVKPENILLDANGNAKLVDFGLAGMQKDTSEIWGTPYYISPEKVKQEVVDYRADMYSLGGTLFHALTGKPPFDGEDVSAVVKARFTDLPPKPSSIRPELSPQIDALVMKMLAFKKEDRFPSFEALLEEFKKVMTTGLDSTSRIDNPAEAGAKKPGGTRKMTMHGRRTMTVRRSGAVLRKPLNAAEDGGSESSAGAEESKSGAKDAEEEEEGGGSLGVKVAGVVVGVIALVGAVIGGLIWYQVSSKNAQEAERQASIVKGIRTARQAIEDTAGAAAKFADEVDALAETAERRCRESSDNLSRLLPDFADLMKPAPTKELLDAIASTNETAAAAPAPVTAPVSTNAAPAEAAAPVATNAAPAEAAAEAPANTEKPREIPPVVNDIAALWERACSCRASAIRVRHGMRKVVAMCATAADVKGEDLESANKLSKLSQDVTEMCNEIKSSKDVENVRKASGYIKDRAKKVVEQAVKRLRIEKIEAERAAKKAAEEEAEKQRQEAMAAARAKLVEDETAEARAKFEAIGAMGSFRQLDWKGAIRQLEAMKAELKTAEGGLAVDAEMRKVNAMKSAHEIFRRNLAGFTFKRSKLKGRTVKSATESDIAFEDGKSPSKLTFVKFYQSYHGNLNELIITFVENGRTNGRPRLNLREWAEAMCGAALTMRIICADDDSAVSRGEAIVKKVVELFPDYASTASEMFPDIDLGGGGAEE
ncbi:MAG: serine/threonine protein kinase [Kiritimatiellae bacterium]|nr:serine/threonine protein kinase [Kiritimatiellia bacterium]